MLYRRLDMIGVVLSMGGDAAVPSGSAVVNTDADMGEELDERWLRREKAAVLAASEIHLMERMLFHSPKGFACALVSPQSPT